MSTGGHDLPRPGNEDSIMIQWNCFSVNQNFGLNVSVGWKKNASVRKPPSWAF